MGLFPFLGGNKSQVLSAKSALIVQLDRIIAELNVARPVPDAWFAQANRLAGAWANNAKDATKAKGILVRVGDLNHKYNYSLSQYKTFFHSTRPENLSPYTKGNIYNEMKREIDAIKTLIESVK
jgi:hypothetical protein